MSLIPGHDLQLLLNAVPGAYLVLKPDLTIVGATDIYLDLTNSKREIILNSHLFSAYGDVESDHYGVNASFMEKLKASVQFVLKHNESHTIAHQKYVLKNNQSVVEEHCWRVCNKPILDTKKNIQYIIHQVEKLACGSLKEHQTGEATEIGGQKSDAVKQQTEFDKLITHQERFRAMINNSDEIVVLMDERGKISFRSPSCNRTTGYTDDDLITKTLLDVVHPDDVEELRGRLQKAIENPGKRIKLIYRERHKLGHYIWAEGTVVNLLHDDNLQAMLLNFRDVTERVNAERKLMESEVRYREVLDNMLEGVQILGFDWQYLYLNKTAIKHSKLTEEELIGHTLLEKFPSVIETDLYLVLKKCFDERVPQHLENRFVYPDQSVAWYELSVQPVPEGVFVLSVDITQRKIAEEKLLDQGIRLQTISDNLPGVIIYQFMSDDNGGGKYTYLSRGVERLSGHSVEEIMENPSILDDIIIDEDRPILVEAEKISYRDLSVFNVEVRCRSANDGLRWINFISTPGTNNEGRLIWNGFLIDITDRKKMEQVIKQVNADLEDRVEQRTEQLKKSNEEMEAFSYSVSHDLRAPLRGIIGFANILEEEYAAKLDDEAKRLTGIIKTNTQKMSNLIDDLLAFSRVGRHQVEKTMINTNDMVEQVINGLDLRGKKDKIKWKVPLLDDAYGDISAIRQVWINLVSNAVKYSSVKEEQRIEIGSYQLKNQVVFFVKDNGVGFDNQYAGKLFKVFQRLHSGNEFEGTGVGLAIVEKIVSKHNGKVWASGVLNEGACFYFSLPVVSFIANKN